MSDLVFECLRHPEEFDRVREEWQVFVTRHFPGHYSRSHPWLSAWWDTYHHDGQAFVYIQRRSADGAIVAAAPLFVGRENFGGFPVRAVKLLGAGLGCEEILVSEESDGFLRELFSDLTRHCRWDIARFRRVRSSMLLDNLKEECTQRHFGSGESISDDLIADLPADYGTFLKSKNSKFRSNLKLGEAKITQIGALSFACFDITDSELDLDSLHDTIAVNSWQYQNGSSHFNDHGSGHMFGNLSSHLDGAEGCFVFILLIADTPAAYMIGVIRDETCYFVDTAFNGTLSNLSLGRIIFARAVEYLIGRGINVFDLEGGGEYKSLYANRSVPVKEFTIYNNTLYGKILNWTRNSAGYAHVRDVAKKMGFFKG